MKPCSLTQSSPDRTAKMIVVSIDDRNCSTILTLQVLSSQLHVVYRSTYARVRVPENPENAPLSKNREYIYLNLRSPLLCARLYQNIKQLCSITPYYTACGIAELTGLPHRPVLHAQRFLAKLACPRLSNVSKTMLHLLNCNEAIYTLLIVKTILTKL
jgi:hypothetical protein